MGMAVEKRRKDELSKIMSTRNKYKSRTTPNPMPGT